MIYTNPLFFEFEPVKIANVFDNGDVKADVSRFIGIYEKQCLKEVLGECLYKDVQDSYAWDTETKAFKLKDDATEAIKRLVNGHSYDAPGVSGAYLDFDFIFPFPYFGIGCGCGCGSSNCKKRIWKGFVQEDEYVHVDELKTIKRSFIADYVYYHYLLVNRTVTAATGQQEMGGENSITKQNFSKRIDRYNEFVFSVLGGRAGQTSLYRFLADNKSDYPEWSPNCDIKFKTKY